MAKGSNDLNMMLKSQVVKLRAELDVPKSMPTIRKQVASISNRLEDKPVKLKVKLDYKIGELKNQLKLLENTLKTSKNASPIKLKVQIDVAGSASAIKKQLRDVYKSVEDFNRKYGEQIKKMHMQTQQASQVSRTGMGAPTNTPVGGFDYKLYSKQINEVKKQMKEMFGAGTFNPIETRDAQGNLTGFIAQLDKANGVVQKIRYEWDANAGKFTPINQQTINSIEKHVHKATQSLRSLYSEIEKLDNGKGKNALVGKYNDLEKRIGHGTLTQDSVKELQKMIKEEQVLLQIIGKENKELVQQKNLIREIENARKTDWKQTGDVGRRQEYNDLLQTVKQTTGSLKEQGLELKKINDSASQRNKLDKEHIQNTKKRMQTLQQIRQIESKTISSDKTSQGLINEIKYMSQRAKSAKEWLQISQKMNNLKTSNSNDAMLQKSLDTQFKIEQKLRELAKHGIITEQQLSRSLSQIPLTAQRSFADLDRQYATINRKLKKHTADMKRNADETVTLIDRNTKSETKQTQLGNINSAVKNNDIVSLQKYIGELYKGQVETVKMENTTDSLGRAVTRLKVNMAGTGKTVRSYSLDLDRANNALRQVSQGVDYNANRNLGIFEQLQIAMKRVPVWMGAMTAFYGTIRSVRAMSTEIMKVDASLTELKRVASDSINIDHIFKGSIGLAKELGNNIHDIMQSMNDYARTFGDFNERQLLAITRTTTLMSNVSELTATEATESLIGTMNAFNITAEESIRIVDVFNEVDNNFAVSTQQLAEGMQKGASTAKTFGVSLEESVGHITAISSVTMESGRIIGNSLKTIYSRITTMDDAKSILEGVGVAIYKIGENGEQVVKPVNDILGDLAGKWHELSDSERQNIAVKVAGRYQLSRFLALMNNWQTALDATSSALTSEGSAMKENNAYMQSFEARINKLKNAFTEMSLAVGDAFLSGAIFNGIEALASLAQMATNLAERFGALPLVLGAVSAVLMKFGVFNKMKGDMLGAMDAFGKFTKSVGDVGWGATLKKSASYVKDVKDGMQEVSVVTRDANGVIVHTESSMKKVDGATKGATASARGFGLALKGALIGTGIGIVAVLIGVAIEKMVGYFQKQKQIAEEVAKANEKLVDSYRNTAGGLDDLISKYDGLQIKVDSGQIKEGTEAWNEYLEVNQELAKQMPSMVKYTDSQGVAHMQKTDAMRKELEIAEKLSKAQADLTMEEFGKNIQDRIKSIGELSKEIDKLNKKNDKLDKEDGKSQLKQIGYGAGAEVVPITIDHGASIQKNKIEAIQAYQEIQKHIQGISLSIRETTLASLEASGHLKDMSETQRSAVEAVIQNNERLLMDTVEKLNNEEQGSKAYKKIEGDLKNQTDQLFAIGEEVGRMISDKSNEMIEGLVDKDKIAGVKADFDNLLKALPKTFFDLESLDNADQFKGKLEDILNVADQVKGGSNNFTGLEEQLGKLGFTADEAKRYVAQLGFQYDNQAIKAETLKQAEEGMIDNLGDYIEMALEATDVTKNLFGYDNTETSALASHVETLQGLKVVYGDNAKQSEQWKNSIEMLSVTLGVEESQIEKNLGHYKSMFDLMPKLELKYNDSGVAVGINTEELNKNEKAIVDNIMKNGDLGLIYDILTGKTLGLTEELDKATAKENENTEATKTNKDAKIDQADATGKLAEKFANLSGDMNQTNKSAYIDTISQQLADFDGKINVTKDQAGNLKLVMADGSSSPYLMALEGQLKDLGIKFGLVRDENGELKLQLNDGTGSSTLAKFDEQATDVKLSIDETVTSVDILNQKKILPNDYSLMNFGEMAKNVDTVTGKVQLLSEAVQGVGENVSAVDVIKMALESLKSKADDMKASIKAVLNGAKGDLDDLAKKAEDAQRKIKELGKALDSIKDKTKNINLGGFEVLKSDINKVKDALGKLDKEFDKVPKSSSKMERDVREHSRSVKESIDKQKKAVGKLGDAYDDAEKDVSSAFKAMKSKVTSNTSAMITSHSNQKSAIDRLKDSANTAKSAVSTMNSTISGAMSSMNNYIAKAKEATSAGNKVPKNVGGGGSGGIFSKLFGRSSYDAPSEGVSSAMATFSATASDNFSSSASSSGDSGSSGIMQPTFTGGYNLDGGYDFVAFATKAPAKKEVEKPAELYKVDGLGRQMAGLDAILARLQGRLSSMNKSTVQYRDTLKSIISYENKRLSLVTKDLSRTESRNKSIEKQLSKLRNTKNHNAKDRNTYNNLQQEYDSNLSKISSLKGEVESVKNDIKAKSIEMFTDFIDQIVSNYDKAIKTIKDKTDNIQFKIDVLDLTDPDNVKEKLNLLASRSTSEQSEQATLKNQEKSLKSEYDKSAKKYGKNSDQAKKAKQELEAVQEAWEDTTLVILRTEKEIRDVRAKVADDGINQLKDYYGKIKDMAVKAIDAEQKALKDAHDKKMKLYDEQIEKVNTLYDNQFKKMDEEKSLTEYQEGLDEKNTKKAELLNKISLLSRDNSLEGRKKLSDLQKELVDAEKEITDFMKARQEDLLRKQLEEQKQAQIDAINTQKEKEEESHTTRIEKLEVEKEAITKKYEDMINDEKRWADVRNAFIKGNFTALNKELTTMNTELSKMNKGNFDMLTTSFKTFSDQVKKDVADMNKLEISNLVFNADGTISAVKQVTGAKKVKETNGNTKVSGTKPTAPKQTTPAKPAPAKPAKPATPAKPKPSAKSSLPLRKGKFDKPKGGWNTNSVVDYIKSKGYYADLSDRTKLFKHLKGSGTYAGSQKQNDWLLKQLKIVGLRNGGYTGDQEGLAYLHKEEQVFKKEDTNNLLDASKILRAMGDIIPKMGRNIPKMSEGELVGGVTNYYELTVNIDKLTGDKAGGNIAVKQIMKGLKKIGK